MTRTEPSKSIPESAIEEIRSRADIVGIVQESLPLKKKGKDWAACCPFHEEKTPSFYVVPDKGFYKCFGCGESGDVFSFLMKRRGLEFPDAVEYVAERVGVDLDLVRNSEKTANPQDASAFEALALLRTLSLSDAEQAIDNARDPAKTLHALGELGRCPPVEAVRGRMTRLGVSDDTIRSIGLHDALDAWAGKWVLWASKGDRVWAGRPVSADGPIVGRYGPESFGWFAHESAKREANLAGAAFLAADDAVYLTARAAGVECVFRAVRTDAASRVMGMLPHRDPLNEPPIVLCRPETESRKAALTLALELLPEIPRLRIAEVTADLSTTAIEKYVERAGTVLDWQIDLLARHGLLDDEDGRKRAATQLRRVVDATDSALEKAFFTAEAERITGVSIDTPTPTTTGRSPSAR